MKHLWTENLDPPRFPALAGDVTTDVLVIGGGMAGILCARLLRERGVDCVLAEAKTIGDGVTKGTTAVLSAQHDTLYTDLVAQYGQAKAKQYLDANLRAVEEFRRLSGSIPCDFEERPSLMYARAGGRTLEREAETVRRLGFPAAFVTETPLPFGVAGAVRYPGMAQFHPLKFLCGAAEGLTVFENTFVRKLKGTAARTDGGTVRAKRVVIATHYPFLNSRGLYFMKLYQMRSFVVALEHAPDLGGTYVGTAEGDMYFRNYKNLLLVGGGDRRTGAKGGGFPAVRDFVRRCFPDAVEKYAWATQDCMSLDGVPYIGRYSPALPDVFVATGFNEWGMTSSMVAASVLADRLTGRKNEFAAVFDPDRGMLKKQLFVNFGTTLGDFVLPTAKRCPHMGCALRWNAAEHTWDCPCHGSRFDRHGRLIDNPAMRDARVE
ncbi:MAG TPA: FAD-dependent oxidoreductase [Oscillospiraceae bacterium]|nr:FAD-dependent oxidoreductase [Oscillospiraceae bacterium]